MFFPLQNTCETISPLDVAPLTTSLYAIRSRTQITPGTDKVGTVYAISVETGKTVWKYEQRAGMMSLVATRGGLVFGGDTNGHFRALDQDTGKVLPVSRRSSFFRRNAAHAAFTGLFCIRRL